MPLLLLIHVLAGLIGVLAGVATLVLRKGAAPHRRIGRLFAVAMLVMGLSGAYRAAFVHLQPINVVAGLFAAYLVTSGWLAARPVSARFDAATAGVAGAGGGLALASLAYALVQWRAIGGDAGAAVGALVFGSLTGLGVIGDVRLITRGPLLGAARGRRHLWRMGLALLLATFSLFLGSPNRILPSLIASTALRWLPIIGVLVGLVIGALRTRGPASPARAPDALNRPPAHFAAHRE